MILIKIVFEKLHKTNFFLIIIRFQANKKNELRKSAIYDSFFLECYKIHSWSLFKEKNVSCSVTDITGYQVVQGNTLFKPQGTYRLLKITSL
jgi:hypothetical protein